MKTYQNSDQEDKKEHIKKQWSTPDVILISSAQIEKNALATKESVAPGGFTPISQYHS